VCSVQGTLTGQFCGQGIRDTLNVGFTIRRSASGCPDRGPANGTVAGRPSLGTGAVGPPVVRTLQRPCLLLGVSHNSASAHGDLELNGTDEAHYLRGASLTGH